MFLKYLNKLSKIFDLVLLSIALVNSSRNNISGFLYIALAIAILCLSPPEKFKPSTPTILSIPSFRLSILSSIFEIFKAIFNFFFATKHCYVIFY